MEAAQPDSDRDPVPVRLDQRQLARLGADRDRGRVGNHVIPDGGPGRAQWAPTMVPVRPRYGRTMMRTRVPGAWPPSPETSRASSVCRAPSTEDVGPASAAPRRAARAAARRGGSRRAVGRQRGVDPGPQPPAVRVQQLAGGPVHGRTGQVDRRVLAESASQLSASAPGNEPGRSWSPRRRAWRAPPASPRRRSAGRRPCPARREGGNRSASCSARPSGNRLACRVSRTRSSNGRCCQSDQPPPVLIGGVRIHGPAAAGRPSRPVSRAGPRPVRDARGGRIGPDGALAGAVRGRLRRLRPAPLSSVVSLTRPPPELHAPRLTNGRDHSCAESRTLGRVAGRRGPSQDGQARCPSSS